MTVEKPAEGESASLPASEHLPPRIYRAPAEPRALVLMLHGGRARGLGPPTALNLPSRRLRPFASTVVRATAGVPALVAQARYRCRGWNGRRADPAQDARAALDTLLARYGDLPVVLLGHSMGGRAALHIAGHPAVRGVVALAPWCPEYEPTAHLAGKPAVLLHSDRDRMTDPLASWAFVERAREQGALAHGIQITGSDHAMLRRSAVWHEWVGRLVAEMIGANGGGSGANGSGSVGADGADGGSAGGQGGTFGPDFAALPTEIVSTRRTRSLPGRS
ncbi:alpha/beta hydrolase [Streptomyces sp. XM4193]|uniref:alpha/beta hydrolase n=1 Tax=Streptomyces sp. XM4193 TaxID=2929782 RepID=UPI001FF9E60E|nr:alpha/beta fold hydrolase [Streptomyces sp. XM4193]MCK1796256.1 alpha/beta hydrolase [Streptomyces sp. XM4193]